MALRRPLLDQPPTAHASPYGGLHETDDDELRHDAAYSPPRARPIPSRPLLVPSRNGAQSSGGGGGAAVAQSLPTHRHSSNSGSGSGGPRVSGGPSMSPQASPPRSLATPVKHTTPRQQNSPVVIGSVPIGSFVPPARPVFLAAAGSPPITTFDELRLAQRQASPARIQSHHHHQLQQLPSSPSILIVAPVASANADEDSDDGAAGPPAGDSAPPLPSSVALSSIAVTDVPSARDELRFIWRLAYPVAFTILARVGMAVTDVSMLGHKDTDYLAGAAAAAIWMNITSAFLYRAFGSSLNTLCAQAFGAGNFKLVGYWLQQGLVFSTLASIFVGLSWWWTEEMMRVLLIEPDIAALAGKFAKWSILWLLPQIWMEMLQRYFQAQQIIFPALVVNGVFVCVNALLNLLLIFGIPAGWIAASINADMHENGWAGLGFIGSPIATVISRWVMLLVYWWYTCAYRKYHTATFTGWALTREEALHPQRVRQYLLQQCLPNAIGVCLEEWQLEIIAVFATRLGSTEIATHNATLEIFFFLTSFLFGLVTAIQVRIGTYLGAGNPLAARQVSVLGLKVSAVIGCMIGACFMLFRGYIGHIYSSDPEIVRLAERISLIVGSAYALMSVFYTAMGTLNGQGRPLIVALSFLIGCWCVCLPLSYVFAFPVGQGLIGLWYGLGIGYFVVTAIVGWRAYASNWEECAKEARERAEVRKQEGAVTQAAELKPRKRRKAKSRRSDRDRAPSLNGGSVTAALDSDTIRRKSTSPSLANAFEESDSASESGYSSSASVSGYSSAASEEWNADEVSYREEQLRLQRRTALAAAATAAAAALEAAATTTEPTTTMTAIVAESTVPASTAEHSPTR